MRSARTCEWIAALGLSAAAAWGAGSPVPVAPGSTVRLTTVAGSCPTFHWAAREDAESWELVIYRSRTAPGASVEPQYELRLPGSASGWTPGLERCLEAGGEYAWMLRGVDESGDRGEWSEPMLFRVALAPSAEEVEAALDVLRRYSKAAPRPHETPAEQQEDPRESRSEGGLKGGQSASLPGSGQTTTAMPKAIPIGPPAVVPGLGVASVTVDQQIHLGPDSHTFKGDELYQWSDLSGNNSLGILALRSNTSGAFNNAIGRGALEFNGTGTSNTAIGDLALSGNQTGSHNTAVGDDALRSNTTGFYNTAVGEDALSSSMTSSGNTAVGQSALMGSTTGTSNTAIGGRAMVYANGGSANTAVGYRALRTTSSNANSALGYGAGHYTTSGSSNIAFGSNSLRKNVTGSWNVAVGTTAGYWVTGGSNIMINNSGLGTDANTLRIGAGTGTGNQQLNTAFIHGIHGRTVAGGIAVLIKSDGQLGTTTSSRRFKEEIEDLGERSANLFELRPVSFRYSEEAAGDGERPLEFGLIAEEVAEYYPELVVYDERGEPSSLRYHLLTPMLLNEVQRLRRELEALRREAVVR